MKRKVESSRELLTVVAAELPAQIIEEQGQEETPIMTMLSSMVIATKKERTTEMYLIQWRARLSSFAT